MSTNESDSDSIIDLTKDDFILEQTYLHQKHDIIKEQSRKDHLFAKKLANQIQSNAIHSIPPIQPHELISNSDSDCEIIDLTINQMEIIAEKKIQIELDNAFARELEQNDTEWTSLNKEEVNSQIQDKEITSLKSTGDIVVTGYNDKNILDETQFSNDSETKKLQCESDDEITITGYKRIIPKANIFLPKKPYTFAQGKIIKPEFVQQIPQEEDLMTPAIKELDLKIKSLQRQIDEQSKLLLHPPAYVTDGKMRSQYERPLRHRILSFQTQMNACKLAMTKHETKTRAEQMNPLNFQRQSIHVMNDIIPATKNQLDRMTPQMRAIALRNNYKPMQVSHNIYFSIYI